MTSRLAAAAAAGLVAVAIAAFGREGQAQAVRAWRLEADTVIVNNAAQIITAQGHVRITDGRIVLTAAGAIYEVRRRRVSLSGGVTAASPDGTLRSRTAVLSLGPTNSVERLDAQGEVTARSGANTLAADRLGYVPAAGTLTASGQVRLGTSSGTATGAILAADLRRKTGTLTDARVQTKEGTIVGDRLDAAGARRQAVLRGNVRGTFGDLRVTSETATVHEREKKVVFRGRVRIIRPGRTLEADTVTFFYAEKRLVAEGQTRIIIQESP